jgi:radical SAM superfamily enzyme YgiQ (UPF0313 family)
MQEIDYICRMGVKEVAVLDPIFNSNENPDHALSILKRFAANGYKGRLELQCRAELVNDAFLDAAQSLDVCLEFGLQTIHRSEDKVIERKNNIKVIDEVLGKVRFRKIRHEVSLIYGLPQQTLQSFQESVRWCLERDVPVIKAFPLLLLRGTKLEAEKDQWGLVIDDDTMPQVVESSTFSRAECETMGRISQALRETEGQHPSIDALLTLAEVTEADIARWQPDLCAKELA